LTRLQVWFGLISGVSGNVAIQTRCGLGCRAENSAATILLSGPSSRRFQIRIRQDNHMILRATQCLNPFAVARTSFVDRFGNRRGANLRVRRRALHSVVVAVSDAAAPLIAAIKQRMSRIKIGAGADSASEMGSLITKEHRDRVASYLDAAEHQGASVEVDGRKHPASSGAGFFLGTSLIDRVEPGMSCYEDEIFGPVLNVMRVGTYDEALRVINGNPYANGTLHSEVREITKGPAKIIEMPRRPWRKR
jgi:hypothetical protein